MENIGALRMSSLSKEMADIFEEESDNDTTFYGFSDSEISDLCDIKGSDSDDGAVKSEQTTPKQTMPKRPPAYRFRLRVALRPRTPAGYRSEEEEDGGGDDDDDDEEVEYNDKEEWGVKVKKERVKPEIKEKPVTKATQKEKVKPEIEEKPLSKETQPQQSGSESETDGPQSFLAKRDQNIKANKAMLAQLMADLHKMPGTFLKNHGGAGKRKKEKGSRPPRSAVATGESRRNPERTSRRQTRSMGGCEDPSTPPEKELELSLEDELLEVHGEPRRRGNPRPNQGKPHVVRLVEEITEDELQLVADNMTEKIYNRATGSTCHQCRQKTIDTKTSCRSKDCRGIMGQFCGPCLRNRYGEDVKKALLDPEWQCPPCRGICNCSFCRARDGRCPTGILFPLAQYHGFSDVHSYLSSLRSKLKTGEEDEDL